MVNKRRWLVAIAAFLVLGTAACGSDSKTTTTLPTDTGTGSAASSPSSGGIPDFDAGTTMAALQAKGKIVVGTKFDQPLFGLRDPASGDINGFDVEIAKIIANKIFGPGGDRKIEFKETPSKIREDSIVNGDVDMVVATYTINDTRKQKVDFAGPYFVAGQDIMVKVADTSITKVADLNGKKVCSVQGSTSLKNLQAKAPQADTSITFDGYALCAEALDNGQVDAVTTDNVILLGLVDQFGDKFKVVGSTFTSEPYGIGVKKGDTAFREFINDVLEASYSDGSWKAAYDSTAGKVDSKTPTPPPVNRY